MQPALDYVSTDDVQSVVLSSSAQFLPRPLYVLYRHALGVSQIIGVWLFLVVLVLVVMMLVVVLVVLVVEMITCGRVVVVLTSSSFRARPPRPRGIADYWCAAGGGGDDDDDGAGADADDDGTDTNVHVDVVGDAAAVVILSFVVALLLFFFLLFLLFYPHLSIQTRMFMLMLLETLLQCRP